MTRPLYPEDDPPYKRRLILRLSAPICVATPVPKETMSPSLDLGPDTAAGAVLPSAARRAPRPVATLVGTTVALGALLALLLAIFILPSLKSGPRDLAVGVVGTPAAVAQLEEAKDTVELPEASGEAIAQEFERYLRRRDKGTGG